MRFQLAALVLTFVVAVVASIFAIWPVVADAPWEDDAYVRISREEAVDLVTDFMCLEGSVDVRETLRNQLVMAFSESVESSEVIAVEYVVAGFLIDTPTHTGAIFHVSRAGVVTAENEQAVAYIEDDPRVRGCR